MINDAAFDEWLRRGQENGWASRLFFEDEDADDYERTGSIALRRDRGLGREMVLIYDPALYGEDNPAQREDN